MIMCDELRPLVNQHCFKQMGFSISDFEFHYFALDAYCRY
jgi:hypothetical protein